MIRKTFALLISLIYFSFLTHAAHAKQLGCTHPQVCNLLELVAADMKITIPKTKLVVSIQGDPHDYHPPVSVVKKLHREQVLVIPPIALQHWLKPIVKVRRAKKLKTLEMPMVVGKESSKLGREARSHFWLEPKTHCLAYNKVAAFLVKNWGDQDSALKPNCPFENIRTRFSAFFNKHSAPFILNHEALAPLLESFSIEYVILNDSGHHSTFSPAALKRAHRILAKNPQIYWLNESQVDHPKGVRKMIRKSDKIISINTLGELGKTPYPLEKLIMLLEAS